MVGGRRLRLLIVTGIFPPDIGGPATYVVQIADALSKRGHEVVVATLSDRSDGQDTRYPFRVVRIPRRLPKPWRWCLAILSLLRFGWRADVLFVNGLALEAVAANAILRKPFVHKVVGDLAWERACLRGWVRDDFERFQRTRYGVRVEMLRALRRWWTVGAGVVIVPSQYLAIWVAGWGVPRQRLRVVYNAVAPPGNTRPAYVPLFTAIRVAIVGRLLSWKRVDQVIEAAAQIPTVGLVIVGDGPERSRLDALAHRLRVADRVYFTGQRTQEEARAFMAACDVLVLNSIYEGLPHVVLEALSLGIPVVATAAGGTPEIVEDGRNGLLLDPADGGAVMRALVQWAQSPWRRHDLAAGAAKDAVRLSLHKMVDETEAVLRSVAHRSHRTEVAAW